MFERVPEMRKIISAYESEDTWVSNLFTAEPFPLANVVQRVWKEKSSPFGGCKPQRSKGHRGTGQANNQKQTKLFRFEKILISRSPRNEEMKMRLTLALYPDMWSSADLPGLIGLVFTDERIIILPLGIYLRGDYYKLF